MSNFKEIEDWLLASYVTDLIDTEEYAALYDRYRARNRTIPYWMHNPFNLNDLSDDECMCNFRFYRHDIHKLVNTLNIPDEIVLENGTKFGGEEALCVMLKRYSYLCRYLDMVPLFGRPIPCLSMISNTMTDLLYNQWGRLLSTFNQRWLSAPNLQMYANSIFNKGAALNN